MSNLSFVSLVGAKHDRPVLIPKNANIICINATDPQKQEPDEAFWVEYIVGHNSQNKAVCVKGPLEDILAALDADTTGSDHALLLDREAAFQRAFVAEDTVHTLQERVAALTIENRALVSLSSSLDWTDTGFHQGVFPFWSTLRIEHVDASLERWGYRFFACPMGQQGQGFSMMTLPLTNIKEGGRLPGGLSCRVYALRLEFLEGTSADVDKVKKHGVLLWDFCQTQVPISPVGALTWDVAGRTGVVSLATVDPPAPAKSKILPEMLALSGSGVTIPFNTTFGVLLSLAEKNLTLTAPLTIRLTLAGQTSVLEIG